MVKYYSTKTYGNDRGFSCAFRQPNATHSHCSQVHGYSLGFKFVFESEHLDTNNWVYDFGDCKWIKQYLEETFDHTLAIDENDEYLPELRKLEEKGWCRLKVMQGVGCEKFAQHVYDYVSPAILLRTQNRVRLHSVEVFEHGANSAIVQK